MAISKKLNELASTAISGNDISSSCLYVSALAIVYSGQLAWIALLMVAAVLFLYRKVYGEVVGALPLNGGAYNALLNTTSKRMASMAATLTLLSYMATAVISASEAMHYLQSIFLGIPVLWSTVALLGLFMGLMMTGISESSKVAIAIFMFHLFSLALLVVFCTVHLIHIDFDTLLANSRLPIKNGSVMMALFFGFSAAMLGISGFESSANFVEEQEKGVFPKTLKNMWIVVTVFNPLMAFLALAILPMESIQGNQEALLSHMGAVSGGSWLSVLISVDATLVLSGAVLTSFVGVSGLVERMSLDRVLPEFLLKKNSRGSSYRIAYSFFFLCVSILFITKGQLTTLAGVYTIAFLSVMVLFGVGNFLLKTRRSELPRPERSSWGGLLVAIAAVIIALIGNALLNPAYLGVFFEYFIPASLLVWIMLERVELLRLLLQLLSYLMPSNDARMVKAKTAIRRMISRINAQEFVFFTRQDNVAILNHVMRYIESNEHSRRVMVVAINAPGEKTDKHFISDLEVITRAYPYMRIEFKSIEGKFGPALVKKLSEEWEIPVNFMFMGSPSDESPYSIEEFGGVRLII